MRFALVVVALLCAIAAAEAKMDGPLLYFKSPDGTLVTRSLELARKKGVKLSKLGSKEVSPAGRPMSPDRARDLGVSIITLGLKCSMDYLTLDIIKKDGEERVRLRGTHGSCKSTIVAEGCLKKCPDPREYRIIWDDVARNDVESMCASQ